MKQMFVSGLLLGASLINNVASQTVCGSTTLSEDNNMMLTLYVSGDVDSVAMTVVGPADNWYGVGFGSTMLNTYAVITEGDGAVSEYKLGQGNAGTQLEDSITTISSNVTSDNVRYANYFRSLTGEDSDYYTFDVSTTSINLIWATSDSSTFAAHTSQGYATISLSEDDCPETDFDFNSTFVSTESSSSDDDDDSSDDDEDASSSEDDDDAAYQSNIIIFGYLIASLYVFAQMM